MPDHISARGQSDTRSSAPSPALPTRHGRDTVRRNVVVTGFAAAALLVLASCFDDDVDSDGGPDAALDSSMSDGRGGETAPGIDAPSTPPDSGDVEDATVDTGVSTDAADASDGTADGGCVVTIVDPTVRAAPYETAFAAEGIALSAVNTAMGDCAVARS